MKTRLLERICLKNCKKNVIRICWRRLHGEPCRLYRKKLEEEKKIRDVKIIEKFDAKAHREFLKNCADTFDSIGNDIDEEEFLENEKFFAMNE